MTDLIHDWNAPPGLPGSVAVLDDTLRDGLQSPSARMPSLPEKLELLALSARSGAQSVILGLPCTGPEAVRDMAEMVRFMQAHHPGVELLTAVRTHQDDIAAHLDLCTRSGVAVTAALFVGCSPIRAYSEGWAPREITRMAERSVQSCVQQGVPVLFVTEDTTRSHPAQIREIYSAALGAGAGRVCVCDTVGHADPSGAAAVVSYLREIVEASGTGAGIDWHGHNDRGLSLVNAIVAAQHGATRLHTTCLGLGERTGNTPLEQLVMYLVLSGVWPPGDLTALPDYCEAVRRHCHAPMPHNIPIVGRDAFRTSSGIHASAIRKALRRGETEIADLVYSSVPASLLGREQAIEIGPMSGQSNIDHWLDRDAAPRSEGLRARIRATVLARARQSRQVLSDEQIRRIVTEITAADTTRPEGARNALT